MTTSLHAAARPTAAPAFDLIVAGAGVGGMTAALVAALEGQRVVLCEASEQVGGTSASSAGTLWMPGNPQGEAAGHGDSASAAERYLNALVGPDDARGLRAAFLASVPSALHDLAQRTEVQFVSAGLHPDYLPHLPGAASAGRAIAPIPFDGRRLGADFDRVRPPMPEFMVLGGMMLGKADIQTLVRRYASLPDFLRAARLVGRYARDRLRWRRGTRLVMGNALVARLLYSLRQAGVEIRFGWQLQDVFMAEGRCVGAVFGVAGEPQLLQARLGVVLATGGVGHHVGLRTGWSPTGTPARSLAAASVQGQGLLAGQAAGGHVEQHAGGNFFWQPVSEVRRADGTTGLFPHLFLDRAKPGLIAVRGPGVRFVNEALSYHHFVEGLLSPDDRQAVAPAWLLCDAAFVRRYGLGIIPPGTRRLAPWVRRGYVTVATSLPALARQLGLDADTLVASVERYNDQVRQGRDLDFGKGETAFDRFNGDAAQSPNPCLGLLQAAPFCALPIWPAHAASSAGLAVNRDGQVLDAQGQPLPGLYACGNDAASLMRGHYPGPGTTLGPALVLGWRIGKQVGGAAVG